VLLIPANVGRPEDRAMTESERFAQLMERVRSGCRAAAQELFDSFSGHILRVVRRKLHQRMRTQYDSVDFAQAVWASFFAVPPERFTFDNPDALAGFLAQVASNKVAEAYRRRVLTTKRDLNREVPLGREEIEKPAKTIDSQPTPSQVAMANERWERLLEGQPPHYRRILEMLRQGHTYREVADRLGLHPKLIQRLIRKLETGPQHP
jgi:RNA polymerase sigma-70 factor (ECF subfamily)